MDKGYFEFSEKADIEFGKIMNLYKPRVNHGNGIISLRENLKLYSEILAKIEPILDKVALEVFNAPNTKEVNGFKNKKGNEFLTKISGLIGL